jgi:hypothetical protein
MERPDKTIGKGKQNFILFNETDRENFPGLPIALSIEEAVITARALAKSAGRVHGAGHALAATATTEQPDLHNFLETMQAVDGEMRMERAEQMIEFAASILDACMPEALDIN